MGIREAILHDVETKGIEKGIEKGQATGIEISTKIMIALRNGESPEAIAKKYNVSIDVVLRIKEILEG